MPLYTFRCQIPECPHEEEHVAKFVEVSDPDYSPAMCPEHNAPLVWQGVEAPRLDRGKGNSAGRFQMHAITQRGENVAGHFGVSSKKHAKGEKQ